jgi:hypothetical protein
MAAPLYQEIVGPDHIFFIGFVNRYGDFQQRGEFSFNMTTVANLPVLPSAL